MNKLTTADKAVEIINSGDTVDYGSFNGKPYYQTERYPNAREN